MLGRGFHVSWGCVSLLRLFARSTGLDSMWGNEPMSPKTKGQIGERNQNYVMAWNFNLEMELSMFVTIQVLG